MVPSWLDKVPAGTQGYIAGARRRILQSRFMPRSPDDFEVQLAPVLGGAYGFAYRLSGNAEDAQDLVQDAVVAALTSWASFQTGTNFKAWFYRILYNRFLNRRRQEQRRPQTLPLDEANEATDADLYHHARRNGLLDKGGDPAAQLVRRLDREAVESALHALPEEFKAVALLSLVEGLSYEEIAAVTGVPVGTVRSRLHRARKLLQKSLRDFLGPG